MAMLLWKTFEKHSMFAIFLRTREKDYFSIRADYPSSNLNYIYFLFGLGLLDFFWKKRIPGKFNIIYCPNLKKINF